jgi:hypothetical protein
MLLSFSGGYIVLKMKGDQMLKSPSILVSVFPKVIFGSVDFILYISIMNELKIIQEI